jgi:hypothetical protein
MLVYLVIWEERHVGVTVEVFKRSGPALERARAITALYDTAEVGQPPEGCLYYSHLSEEGEHVTVKEAGVLE